MSNDLQLEITDLLEEQQRIPRSKLSPSSRLLQDLGVDGDDAAELFQYIHDRYGTDFTALGEQWRMFFGNEGVSLRSGLAVFIPPLAISVPVSIHFNLSQNAAGLIGVVIFFGFVWLAPKVLPERELRPVTIAGLAEIVRQGAWPRDPSAVS